MGARVIRKPDSLARRKRETLTLRAIVMAVALPLLLTYVVIAVDMRLDLSEFRPARPVDDRGFALLGWPQLETAGYRGQVRMIGYMMDGYRPSSDGASVDMFVLLPEAGQLLHPAHRIPNQMVEVHPRSRITFRKRRLVWVSGKLDRTMGEPGYEKAAWTIGEADVSPAQPQDISKWFLP